MQSETYRPITISECDDWPSRAKEWDKLFTRCNPLRFYLDKLLEAYLVDGGRCAGKIIAQWESTAPRPEQRRCVLAGPEDDEPESMILYGKKTGTGKTTSACERIWRETIRKDGRLFDPDGDWPVIMTGLAFAREAGANARKLNEWICQMTEASWLLIDDVDKKGDSNAKLSKIVEQALYDVIEDRTANCLPTILTLNSDANELGRKFSDEVGPYIMRRIEERFVHINFDPL